MPDYGFISNQQQPDSFRRIGEMVGTMRGMTELQKARETLQADVERAKAESSRAVTESGVAAQTAQPRIDLAGQQARQAEIRTNLDKFKLTGEYAQRARDIGQQLVSDPDVVQGNAEAIIPKIRQARDMMIQSGVPADIAEVNASHLISAAAASPKEFRQLLLNSIQAGLGAGGQAANIRPSGINVTNQQQTQTVEANPFSATPVGQALPGTPQQQQLPPTTQVFNTETNAPGYLGPQAPILQTPSGSLGSLGAAKPGEVADLAKRDPQFAQILNEAQSGKGKPVQSGPALGADKTETGKAELVNQHFAEAAGNAASSSLLKGIAQNIKTFGAQAIVGTEQEKLSFLNGLLEKIGIPGASDLKTATDLMEKNMAQLAKNSPAATDAARVVNQLASPHPTMNAKAIAEAADQIIGQVRMSRDVYKTFLPLRLKSDNAEYLKKLGEFADVSDARVWQFEALGPAERAAMVAQMKPEDRAAFKTKIERAEKMGFFK